jgi:hypothetical protein
MLINDVLTLDIVNGIDISESQYLIGINEELLLLVQKLTAYLNIIIIINK